MDKNIAKAVEVFKNGGIVIFPTDTAIGIGCRIDNAQTVRKLFNIRKRPETKAVPVLFNSINMVRKYVEEIPQDVEDIAKKYWPGALTLVLHSNRVKVPLLVRGGGETLGVRIPDNKVIRTIITEVGVPILGPSANFSGEKTPFRFADLNPKLVNLVDYVLNGEINSEDNVSTIIDCTITPWKIIRQGAIKIRNSSIRQAQDKIKNVVLVMDTADNKKIAVSLIINGKRDIQTKRIISNKTQVILPMIDKILKKHSLELKDLSGININVGPGSFTGLRIGLAIANALSFVLKIPINGKKIGEILLPVYT